MLTVRTKLGRKQRTVVGRIKEIENRLADPAAGGPRFVSQLADDARADDGTAYDPILAGGKAQLAGSWRGYGGGAHRQEKCSHFMDSIDLGGGFGKALLAGARKNWSHV